MTVNRSRSRSSVGCSGRPLHWVKYPFAALSPEQVFAWRLTVPEGHRFEATQALRQVLNRAVTWKLLDENPAKRGVPNPGRRCREQRPFDGRRSGRSPTCSGRASGRWSCSRPRPASALGAVRARTGRRRSRRRRCPDSTGVRKRTREADEDATQQARGAAAEDRVRGARPASPAGATARCCFRTHAAATSTSATSTAGTGSPFRRLPGSSRCATSTTSATPTPPSRSSPACRCSRSRASWARASR